MVDSSKGLRNPALLTISVPPSSYLSPSQPSFNPSSAGPQTSSWDIFNEYAENREDTEHDLQALSGSPNAHWTLTGMSACGRFPTTFQELEKLPISDIVDGFIDSSRFNDTFVDTYADQYSETYAEEEIYISHFSPDESEPSESPNFILRLPIPRSRRGSRNRSVSDASVFEEGGVKQTVLLAAQSAGRGVGKILSSLSARSATFEGHLTPGDPKSAKKSATRRFFGNNNDLLQPVVENAYFPRTPNTNKDLPPAPYGQESPDYLKSHFSPDRSTIYSDISSSENFPPQPSPAIKSGRRTSGRRHVRSPSEPQISPLAKPFLQPPRPRIPLPKSPRQNLRPRIANEETGSVYSDSQSTSSFSDTMSNTGSDTSSEASSVVRKGASSPVPRFYHHKSPSEPTFATTGFLEADSSPAAPALSLPTSPTCRLPNQKRNAIRLASNNGDGKRSEWDPNALLDETLFNRPRRPLPAPLPLQQCNVIDRIPRAAPNERPVSPRASSVDSVERKRRLPRLPVVPF